MGKSSINGPFSMAMLNNQRVKDETHHPVGWGQDIAPPDQARFVVYVTHQVKVKFLRALQKLCPNLKEGIYNHGNSRLQPQLHLFFIRFRCCTMSVFEKCPFNPVDHGNFYEDFIDKDKGLAMSYWQRHIHHVQAHCYFGPIPSSYYYQGPNYIVLVFKTSSFCFKIG